MPANGGGLIEQSREALFFIPDGEWNLLFDNSISTLQSQSEACRAYRRDADLAAMAKAVVDVVQESRR